MDTDAELEISLHRGAPGAYYLDFHFRLPESDLHLEQAEVRFDLQDLSRSARGASDFAQKLSAQLFGVQEVKTAFMRALDIARLRCIPLNLRLLISQETPELHNLPWEALLDPQDGFPLFTRPEILFSRYLSSRNLRAVKRGSRSQLRALAAVANPSDLGQYPQLKPIDVQAEMGRLRLGLSCLSQPVVELPGPQAGPHASLEAILGLLQGKNLGEAHTGFDILYLVCHGSLRGAEPYLWLEDESGRVRRVNARQLARWVEELERPPALVVLASCESAGRGEGQALAALGPRLVEAGIPAVLGMQGEISVETIARFMPVFFAELVQDGQVHRAAAVARGQVRDRPDWWMPALFSCLRDNRLFDIPAGETANMIPRQYFEPETVYVPAGAFLIGLPESAAGASYEKPQHEVFLPGYRIGIFPVTNAQFEVFIRKTRRLVHPALGWEGQAPPADRRDHPVVGITWFEALAYCDWLSEQTGRQYCLPSEAQWEKAARGVDGRLYPWGNDWEPGRCNFGGGDLAAVNGFPPQSPSGCCDLVGNVRQWCRTLWGVQSLQPDPRYLYPYREDGRDELKANREIRRVLRGSSYQDDLEKMRCSAKSGAASDDPGLPGKGHGLRVVMELTKGEAPHASNG